MHDRQTPFQSTLSPSPHPYLNGAWTPQHEEVVSDELEVIGEIPTDLNGIYIRNTENPLHDAIGVYHPFDGDGMIHAMTFAQGRATYRNRFVRTKSLLAEQEANRSLWAGIAANPKHSERPGWGARGDMKDASSTDVIFHNGEILSTFYMCGEGYRLDPETLETLGTAAYVPPTGISAHPKLDPHTGEMLFFNYGKDAPYMHYGVVNATGERTSLVPIELPGPRLPHDMAFTENYSILNDCPLFWDDELLARGIHSAQWHGHLPTRFAIIPRHGNANDIRWFEAAPTYVLHWMNAWEEGNEIILDGYFQDDPDPAPLDIPGIDPRFGKLLANIDEHSFKPKLHRWRFNLETGKTVEERLDDRTLEFGTFNPDYTGRRSRYLYSTTTKPGWFLFNGIVKHDLETGDSETLMFGENRFGSEAPFAPRPGAGAEDEGYLLSFITDLDTDQSECVIIDAQNVSAGPVARIILPHRISSGTHAAWASRDILAAA
ncbi:MAG: carotenoid oxygenase family protein [Pseudomonadota bacterium]